MMEMSPRRRDSHNLGFLGILWFFRVWVLGFMVLSLKKIQGKFKQRSSNIQLTCKQHSSNIQATFNQRSSNVQATFNQRSSNVQATFKQRSSNVQATFNQPSTNVQPTFNQRSINRTCDGFGDRVIRLEPWHDTDEV
jgi:hypothetical protein